MTKKNAVSEHGALAKAHADAIAAATMNGNPKWLIPKTPGPHWPILAQAELAQAKQITVPKGQAAPPWGGGHEEIFFAGDKPRLRSIDAWALVAALRAVIGDDATVEVDAGTSGDAMYGTRFRLRFRPENAPLDNAINRAMARVLPDGASCSYLPGFLLEENMDSPAGQTYGVVYLECPVPLVLEYRLSKWWV